MNCVKYENRNKEDNLKRGINIKDYIAGDGTNSDSTTLAALLVDIGSDNTSLYVPAGTYLLDDDVIIPVNVELIMALGAKFKGDAGTETITINGGLKAGLYQIFEDILVDGSPKIDVCYVEWFGAVADADYYDSNMWYADAGFSTEATDNTSAFTTAFTFFPKTYIQEGNYYIGTTVTLPNDSETLAVVGIGDVKVYISARDGVQYPAFSSGSESAYYENIHIESKNLYGPWISSAEQAGTTSNIQAFHSHYSGNITLKRCSTLNCSYSLFKSNLDYATENYIVEDCTFENASIGIYLQKATNIHISNTKITTADTSLDLFCHPIYMGADVYDVYIDNCYIEALGNATGSLIKFSFDASGALSASKCGNIQINNCTCKTASTQGFELTAIEGMLVSNCSFEFTKSDAADEKLVILSEASSEGILFDGCKVNAVYLQRLFEEYSGEWTTDATPIVMKNSEVIVTGYDAGLYPSIINNTCNQYFDGCRFICLAGGAVTICRGSGDEKVVLVNCYFESPNYLCNYFNLGSTADYEVYNCVFKQISDRDVITTYNASSTFSAYNNVFYNSQEFNSAFVGTDVGNIFTGRSNEEAIILPILDETTDLTTGTAKFTFRMPYAFRLSNVKASVNTAPTDALITVDINESGTTILSTKLTIDATEKTSATATTAVVISDADLADDAEITIDIDTVGSTIAGKGLKVVLMGRRN